MAKKFPLLKQDLSWIFKCIAVVIAKAIAVAIAVTVAVVVVITIAVAVAVTVAVTTASSANKIWILKDFTTLQCQLYLEIWIYKIYAVP